MRTKRIERDWSWHLAQAGRQNKTLAQYAREHRVSVSNDRMPVQARLRNGVTVELALQNHADALWALLNVLSRRPCSD